MQNEELIFKVLLDASNALQSLSKLDKSTQEYQEGVKNLALTMDKLSGISGIAWTGIEHGLSQLSVTAKTTDAQFQKLVTTIKDVRNVKFTGGALGGITEYAKNTSLLRDIGHGGTDATALSQQEKLTTLMAERALTEEKVAIAEKKIASGNVKQSDAEMIALQEKLVASLSNRAMAEEKVALAEKKLSEVPVKKESTMLFAPRDADQRLAKLKKGLTEIEPLIKKIDLSGTAGSWGKNVATMETAIRKLAKTTGKDFKTASDEIKNAFKGKIDTSEVDHALANIRKGSMSLGDHFKNLVLNIKNVMSTMAGTLTAMAIFQVMQAVTTFFTDAFTAAKEFRAQLASLNISEAVLSKKGMDISLRDFDQFIAEIQSRYKGLSKLEATSIVGNVASAAQEFKISKDQLGQLSDVMAYINTQEKMMGRNMTDAGSVLNAAMDARSNFFNAMGINITKEVVMQKAIEMGLIQQGQQLEKNVSIQAVLALLVEQTAGKQGELNKQLEGTAAGTEAAFGQKVSDASLAFGENMDKLKIAAMDLALVMFDIADRWNSLKAPPIEPDQFKGLASGGDNTMNEMLKNTNILVTVWDMIVTSAETLLALVLGIAGAIPAVLVSFADAATAFVVALSEGKSVWEALGVYTSTYFTDLRTYVEGILALFYSNTGSVGDTVIRSLYEWATGRDYVLEQSKKALKQDTTTGDAAQDPAAQSSQLGVAIDGSDKSIEDAYAKLAIKVREENIKFEQQKYEAKINLDIKLEDINIKYAQKVQDIITKYNQNIEDATRSLGDKLSNIENDTNKAIADANTKFQNDQINAEQQYQNKLKDLRDRYLMDLEDALHARDARQVLRLMKQYKMDKDAAARDRTQQKEAAGKAHEEELRKIEQDRQDKIESARIEHEQKLRDLEIAKEREMEAADLARKREQEAAYKDYQQKAEADARAHQQRLDAMGRALTDEFNLTQQGAEALRSMLQGNLDAYLQYTQSMVDAQNNAIGQINNGFGSIGGGITPVPSPSPTPPSSGGSSGGSWWDKLWNRVTVGDGNLTINPQGKGFAEGGMAIADKPTTVTFGEGGLEMASFVPMNRMGSDVGKMFDMGVGKGEGGNRNDLIAIDLNLSPDLESRITRNTLDKTAKVMMRVRNSK